MFVTRKFARPHLSLMFEYDSNPSVTVASFEVFDFLIHEVLDVLRGIASDLNEAVDGIGFKLGKPLCCVVTEAFRSLKLPLFESFVAGISVTEEFTKTLLGEGDIGSDYSGHLGFSFGLSDRILHSSRTVGGSDVG